jgi:hypothetical protein
VFCGVYLVEQRGVRIRRAVKCMKGGLPGVTSVDLRELRTWEKRITLAGSISPVTGEIRVRAECQVLRWRAARWRELRVTGPRGRQEAHGNCASEAAWPAPRGVRAQR